MEGAKGVHADMVQGEENKWKSNEKWKFKAHNKSNEKKRNASSINPIVLSYVLHIRQDLALPYYTLHMFNINQS